MYQMDPAGIDVVEEAEDPNDEATSEIPARPRTPPMMNRIRKALRNVSPPLPKRRPARCVRHARRPFSPTVATPQRGMGSQNLNALCDGQSLTELRTRMRRPLLGRCDWWPSSFGGRSERQHLRLAVVPNQFDVPAPIDQGFEQILRLVAADARGKGFNDFLPGERPSGLPSHVRDEVEHGHVVDDVPDDRLPLPHVRVEELATEVRDADVPVLDGREPEEFGGTEDWPQPV